MSVNDYYEAVRLHREKRLLEAEAACRKFLLFAPSHPDGLSRLGMILFDSGRAVEAVDAFRRVLSARPGDALACNSLGNALVGCGRIEEAERSFRLALELKPGLAQARTSLTLMAIRRQEYEESIRLLREGLPFWVEGQGLGDEVPHLKSRGFHRLAWVLDRIRTHRAGAAQREDPRMDTLFLDGALAGQEAAKHYRVACTQSVDGQQLCYADTRPPGSEAEWPENLLFVPVEHYFEFFMKTRLRWPQLIAFDEGDAVSWRRAGLAALSLDVLQLLRLIRFHHRVAEVAAVQPDWRADQPVRVFLASSRETTVMQHCSHDLAEAFRRLGCEVKFLIEADDRERFGEGLVFLEEYEAFRPHLTVNINWANNGYLHPSVFNVIWWQDPMPAFTEGKPMMLRDRDLVLSAYREYDHLLQRCGVKEVGRQEFCVDTRLFSGGLPWEERRKVVFVGSSHIDNLKRAKGKDEVVGYLRQRFLSGNLLSRQELADLAQRSGLVLETEVDFLYSYVVRDTCVEWLCSLAGRIPWEIEVYGRFWDRNPIVAPFFKGEIRHGADLAALYGQARYGLNAHQATILSQRLVEMAACGCVPLLNDDRANAEPPHWEEHCLFFRNAGELLQRLKTRPPGDPRDIAQAYSYETLAKRILKWMGEVRGRELV
ncbi:MAG: tetratricopeptide repeat protein [Magnetococcales bacterium]|nr:tetratricopeptide repeat protein [Magnetococcales bacterium]